MATAISGPKTMWRGVGAGDGAGSPSDEEGPLDLLMGPPNLACIFQIPDVITGVGAQLQ